MAKYNVTHSCGHVERVDLIGPHRSREWRVQRMEQEVCRDCRQAELQRQNARAAEENKVAELPSLTGTEKQIPWAESIRARLICAVQDAIRGTDWMLDRFRKDPDLPAAIDALCAETQAHWWIEMRDAGVHAIISQMLGTARKQVVRQAEAQSGLEAKAEATVRPPQPKTETVAEIRVTGKTIDVLFPERHDDFRLLMRELRYKWVETMWQRNVGQFNGATADRVAEVGHKLLATGFSVRIFDADLRGKAVAGEYEPEPRRWVKKCTEGTYAGWFILVWPRSQDFYAAAKRINGSRYKDGAVHVPAEHFEQVLDFAQLYQFHISPGAEELAAQAKKLRDLALVAQVPAVPAEPEIQVIGRVPPKLEVPNEVRIDAALRDDIDEDIPDNDVTA